MTHDPELLIAIITYVIGAAWSLAMFLLVLGIGAKYGKREDRP